MSPVRAPAVAPTTAEPTAAVPAVAIDAAVTADAAPVSRAQLAAVQRLAGNAAVTALIARRRTAPAPAPVPAASKANDIPVSRTACCDSCAGGGTCASKGDDERTDSDGGAEVQRLGWDDVTSAAGAVGRGVSNAASAVGHGVADAAGAVVPDWVRNLFSSAPGEADRQQAGADQEATHASQEASQAEQSTGQQAQTQGERTAGEADRGTEEQQTALDRGEAETRQGSGNVRAAAVGGLQTLAGVASPALAPFVNPAIAIARPAALDQAAGRVADAGAAVAGNVGQAIAPGLREAGGAFDGYQWNCDFAEVASRAGRVGRGVFHSAVGLADLATKGRASRVIAFAGDLAGRARTVGQNVVGRVRGYASRLQAHLSDRLRPFTDRVQALGSRVRAGIDRVASRVRDGAAWVRERAVAGFERARARVAERVQEIGGRLRNAGQALLGRIRQGLQIAGAIISRIFPGAPALLERVRAGIERTLQRARELAEVAKARLLATKDRILAAVRQRADQALQRAIRIGQAVGQRITAARQWISDHRNQIIAAIPGGPMIAAVVGAATAMAARIRSAAGDVAKRASGAVCSAVGEVGGPCVNQYLPNPGGGQTATLTLTSTADVTLPLHEVGVPCSVRLARGAKVTIKREGDTFTVTIEGEGAATAVEDLEASAEGTASVSLPSSGSGSVWQRLGGANGNPPGQAAPTTTPASTVAVPLPMGGASGGAGAPTPTVSQVGQQAAGGQAAGGTAGASSPGASFEGGVRGKVEQEYQFTAGGNACAGLGGMLALNGALGVAGSLPEPLCTLASQGVHAAFLPQLQKSTFTSSVEGTAEIKLFEAGSAGAAAKITAELSAAAGRRRATDADRRVRAGAIDTDGFIDELTIGGKLAGEASFSLPGAGPVSGLSGSVSPELSVALTLVYLRSQGRIEPEKAEAKVSLELALSSLDLGALGRLLPGPGGNVAVERLRRFATASGAAKVKVETTVTVDDLDRLYHQMEAYFATPESVTVEGTIALVRQHLATGVTRGTTVTLTRSETVGANLGGQGTVEGATIGANVGASAEMALETQIYPAA